MKTLNKKTKKEEPKESMGASSSGSFESPMSNKVIKKKDIVLHNFDLNEILGGTDAGQFDVPLFGKSPKGKKNPLKIDGPDSVKGSKAVKDKNFPKWGGPDSIFIKIKDKCKKFPYCNQGDINSIEILKESINEISKSYGIPRKELEIIVLNEIKRIFI